MEQDVFVLLLQTSDLIYVPNLYPYEYISGYQIRAYAVKGTDIYLILYPSYYITRQLNKNNFHWLVAQNNFKECKEKTTEDIIFLLKDLPDKKNFLMILIFNLELLY